MTTIGPRHLRGLLSIVLATTVLLAACSSDDSSSDGASGTTAPAAEVTASDDVYALVGGCYALVDETTDGTVSLDGDGWVVIDGTDGATPFFLQATALGRYLLYGTDGQMVAAADGDAIEATTVPGPPADWAVASTDAGFSLTNVETGAALSVDEGQLVQASPDDATGERWSFAATTDCDPFPDIDPGAAGEPFGGDGPDAPVRGFFDSHTHVSAFTFLGGSFHCGRPWSPYGVTVALADCPDHVDGGVGMTVEALFSGQALDATHPTDGWPTFEGWPKPDSLTHETTYWRWLERAWRGGLRLMVNDLVDNRALCELYPIDDGTECGDMPNVRDQAADMVALQDYIDAQFGGPGKGFFRLVRTPEEAREVINDGKLAVVLGVEVSEILGCGREEGDPLCDEDQIDAGLDELVELGVVSAFPVHKFDNALGGTAYDGGVQGILVNAGNAHVTGEWWDPDTCAPDAAEADNTVVSPAGTIDVFAEEVANIFGDDVRPILEGELPTYPPDPHCNPRGLTDLGRYMIDGMIERDMIVETDHLSVRGRAEALDLLEERGYPGVITSHSWGDATSQARIVALGGLVAPYAGTLPGFVDTWRGIKAEASPDVHFGLGYGSDNNGLGAQPRARDASAGDPVEYPYVTFDGGTVMDQQVSGERTFDINVDGVAHYGLFPDWIEDIRGLAGDEMVEDMAQGAEAYLQLWERARAHDG